MEKSKYIIVTKSDKQTRSVSKKYQQILDELDKDMLKKEEEIIELKKQLEYIETKQSDDEDSLKITDLLKGE